MNNRRSARWESIVVLEGELGDVVKKVSFLSLAGELQDGSFDTLTVFGIGTLEVGELTFLDVFLGVLQMTSNVVNQVSLFFGRHETIQVTSLDKVNIFQSVGMTAGEASDFFGSEGGSGDVVLVGATEGVGFVVGSTATVTVDSHGTITLVVDHTRLRLVDRNLRVVGTKAMTMSIRVTYDDDEGVNTVAHPFVMCSMTHLLKRRP